MEDEGDPPSRAVRRSSSRISAAHPLANFPPPPSRRMSAPSPREPTDDATGATLAGMNTQREASQLTFTVSRSASVDAATLIASAGIDVQRIPFLASTPYDSYGNRRFPVSPRASRVKRPGWQAHQTFRTRSASSSSVHALSANDIGSADAETRVVDGIGAAGIDQTAPEPTLELWATAAGDTQISAAWVTQQFDALKGTNAGVHVSVAAAWAGVLAYPDDRSGVDVTKRSKNSNLGIRTEWVLEERSESWSQEEARPSPLSNTDGVLGGPTLNIDEFAQFVFSNQRCAELERLMIKIRYGSDQRGSGGLPLHLRADQLGANFRQREKTHLLGQGAGLVTDLFDSRKNSAWKPTATQFNTEEWLSGLNQYFIRTKQLDIHEAGAGASELDLVRRSGYGCACVRVTSTNTPAPTPAMPNGTMKADQMVLPQMVVPAGLSLGATSDAPRDATLRRKAIVTNERAMPLLVIVKKSASGEAQKIASEAVTSAYGADILRADDSNPMVASVFQATVHPPLYPIRGKVLVHSQRNKVHRRLKNIASFGLRVKHNTGKLSAGHRHDVTPAPKIAVVSDRKACVAMWQPKHRKHWVEFASAHLAAVTVSDPNRSANDWDGEAAAATMDPMRYWGLGFQIIALPACAPRRSMYLEHGLFRMNGGCGFVKKPPILLNNPDFDPTDPASFAGQLGEVRVLCVNVVSGRFLRDCNGDALQSPVVQISLHGVEADRRAAPFSTRTPTVGNSYSCFWQTNEQFMQEVTCPDLAMLCIATTSCAENGGERDAFDGEVGGQECIPVRCLRCGYRVIQLHDRNNKPISGSKILVHISEVPQAELHSTFKQLIEHRGVPALVQTLAEVGDTPTKQRLRASIALHHGLNKQDSPQLEFTPGDSGKGAVLNLAHIERVGHSLVPAAEDAEGLGIWDMQNGQLVGHCVWVFFRDDTLTSTDLMKAIGITFPCRAATHAFLKLLIDLSPGQYDVSDSLRALLEVKFANIWRNKLANLDENGVGIDGGDPGRPSQIIKGNADRAEIITRIQKFYRNGYAHITLPCLGRSTHPVKIPMKNALILIEKRIGTHNLTADYSESQELATEVFRLSDESPFEFLPQLRVAFVTGGSGSGKTVLGSYLAYQWAERRILVSFKLVFVISLNSPAVKTADSLASLIHMLYFAKNLSIDTHDVKDMLEELASQTLLIIDDIDKYEWNSLPYVQKLLLSWSDKHLPYRMLLAAPSKTDAFQEMLHMHGDNWYNLPPIMVWEAEGFLAECMTHATELKGGDSSDDASYAQHQAAEVASVINRVPLLRQLGDTPVMLALISGVVLDLPVMFQDKSPQDELGRRFSAGFSSAVQTEQLGIGLLTFFGTMVDMLCEKYHRRWSSVSSARCRGPVSLTPFDCTPVDMHDIMRVSSTRKDVSLKPLQRLAYESYIANKPFLDVGDAELDCVWFAHKVGVLKATKIIRIVKHRKEAVIQYSFATQYFQILYTAQHVADKPQLVSDQLLRQFENCLVHTSGEKFIISRSSISLSISEPESQDSALSGPDDDESTLDRDNSSAGISLLNMQDAHGTSVNQTNAPFTRMSSSLSSLSTDEDLPSGKSVTLAVTDQRYLILLPCIAGQLASRAIHDGNADSPVIQALVKIIEWTAVYCPVKVTHYKGAGERVGEIGVQPMIYALCLSCITEVVYACTAAAPDAEGDNGGIDDSSLLSKVMKAADSVINREKLALNGGTGPNGSLLKLAELHAVSACLPLLAQLKRFAGPGVAMSSLVEIDVGSNQFGPDGMAILAEGISAASSLLKLNVSSNNIGRPGTISLVGILNDPRCNIRELRCHDNAIGDEGATAFALVLDASTSSSLTYLGLMNNSIGDDGAIKIFSTLASQATLCKLGLNGNRIGKRGADKAIQMLQTNVTLTHLALGVNQIEYEELLNFANYLDEQWADDDDGNTTLREVILFGNPDAAEVRSRIIANDGQISERVNFAEEFFVV